jgi:hypothetical protein
MACGFSSLGIRDMRGALLHPQPMVSNSDDLALLRCVHGYSRAVPFGRRLIAVCQEGARRCGFLFHNDS